MVEEEEEKSTRVHIQDLYIYTYRPPTYLPTLANQKF